MPTQTTMNPPELIRPPAVEEGWTRKKLPEMQEWDKPGTEISGKLLSVTPIEINPEGAGTKKVLQYLIQATDALQIKFLGTYDLVQKLNRPDIGKLVRIKYLGEDRSVKKGSNYMKVFDVQTKPDPRDAAAPPNRDSGPITDDDIPF